MNYVIGLSAAQISSVTVLVELLIDRGVITPEDAIDRYRSAHAALEKSDAGPAGAAVLSKVVEFLQTKYKAQGTGGGTDTPH